MFEITNILIQFSLFLLISFFPFNKKIKFFSNVDISEYTFIIFNIITFLFFLLILSFTKIDVTFFFKIIIFLYLIFFIFNFKENLKLVCEKKYLILKIFFLIINLVFFVEIANNTQLGWDGISIWLIKAKNFFNGNNYFQSFTEYDIAKNYPHLGSYVWAFFWKNSFLQYEYTGRFFQSYIYIISIFLLINSFRNLNQAYKIIIAIILILFTYDNNLRGYQDYLVFSLLIFSVKLLTLIKSNKKLEDKILILFFTLTLVLLCFVKSEGSFYSIFLSLCFLFKTRNKSYFIIVISSVLFCILFQYYVVKILNEINNLYLIKLDLVDFFLNIDFKNIIERIFYITYYSFHALLKYPIILVNFFSILLSLIYLRNNKIYNFLYLFFILNVGFIFAIYILTNFPVEWHLQTSIKRLYLQTSGVYFFFFIIIINNKIINFKYFLKYCHKFDK